MKNFLINLAFFIFLGVVLLILFPDIMRQVFGLYNGLGILPIFILLVVVAALPRRKRGKRR
jgi:hypothetical protein